MGPGRRWRDARWALCEAALLLAAAARAQKGVGTQEISYRVADLNRCAKTVSGHRCQAWGENDFGLDPSFRRCAKVDGLDKPWCYTSGDDWDYCDCSGDTDDDEEEEEEEEEMWNNASVRIRMRVWQYGSMTHAVRVPGSLALCQRRRRRGHSIYYER